MEQKLGISVCSYLLPEVAYIIKNGNFPDVRLLGFPANCASNSLKFDQIIKTTLDRNIPLSDLYLIHGNCHPSILEETYQSKKINIKGIHIEQNFELFINKEIILHFIKQGYYIVTNGWLRAYNKNIKNWGFDKETAKSFFKESMKGILLMDTKIPGDYLPKLTALSEYMDLPYEIIPIGLSHCENYINALVEKWRTTKERKSLNNKLAENSQQNADFLVLFHQLEILVNLTDEDQIIQSVFEFINLIFAPQHVKYIKYLNHDEKIFDFKGIPINYKPNLHNSFKINIIHSNELLGTFEVYEVQFPQFIDQYKKMRQVISQVCGLSISNARKYQEINEQNLLLTQYYDELKEANNTKNKLFSIIAHDLKSPFNSILGYSDLLKKKYKTLPEEKLVGFINHIYNASRNTFKLLEDLLLWSRFQRGLIEINKEVLNLKEIITQAIEPYLFGIEEKKISFSIDIPDNTLISADSFTIKTTISNLFNNAIKFTHKNGNIKIQASTQANSTEICISDNGIGISQENIPLLFQMEKSITSLGTNNEKGTGLGLLICKDFIEKNKGKIWVTSELEKGTNIYISLPSNNNPDK